MDAMRRACKALIEEHKFILAVKLTSLHEPDHIGKQPNELPY
jgi:hypothetical protein